MGRRSTKAMNGSKSYSVFTTRMSRHQASHTRDVLSTSQSCIAALHVVCMACRQRSGRQTRCRTAAAMTLQACHTCRSDWLPTPVILESCITTSKLPTGTSRPGFWRRRESLRDQTAACHCCATFSDAKATHTVDRQSATVIDRDEVRHHPAQERVLAMEGAVH